METIVLYGAEQVQQAGHSIAASAEEMTRAANSIAESVSRLERILTEDRELRGAST
jgi:methyl-accepting chemotaxis protein